MSEMEGKKKYRIVEKGGNIYTAEGNAIVVCDECGYVVVPGVTDKEYAEDCQNYLSYLEDYDSEVDRFRDFMYPDECPKCGTECSLNAVGEADNPFHMACAEEWCKRMNAMERGSE